MGLLVLIIYKDICHGESVCVYILIFTYVIFVIGSLFQEIRK